ncbi:MAG: hypothetical protein JWO33_940, partial [Caulobacteraceae bacterium]|nr:hypothetical protein [Caulobacteraceae bacterium]
MSLRRGLGIAAVLVLALLVGAAWVWRADIGEALLDPGVPFQTYKPPPAPDYAKPIAWALLPADPGRPAVGDPPVDVFFIHPTTFDGGRDWNQPVARGGPDRTLSRVMLPNYAGPFRTVGRMFAPRYRQASLYTLLTARDDARESRAFAYEDIRAAFQLYLQRYNQGRPFIIVGAEQGGFLGERLLIDLDPALRERLVAAYLIETPVPKDTPPIAPCTARAQAHCLIAWISAVDGEPNTLTERLRHSLVWAGDHARLFADRRPVCVNPVTGALDTRASAKGHLGGVNASNLDWDARPAFLAHQVSTECRNDILHVSR